jgi:hypothetical protein
VSSVRGINFDSPHFKGILSSDEMSLKGCQYIKILKI